MSGSYRRLLREARHWPPSVAASVRAAARTAAHPRVAAERDWARDAACAADTLAALRMRVNRDPAWRAALRDPLATLHEPLVDARRL